MSSTVTLSMPTLMLAIPGLVMFSGAVTFVALRSYLNDAVDGHRVLANVDERSARWLFLRGYRKTPHAGPDVTPEPDVAQPQMLALSDRPAADDDERDGHIGYLLALAVAYVVLAPVAFVRGQAGALGAWLRDRVIAWKARRAERHQIGSGEQATSDDPFAELLAHAERDPAEGIRQVLAASGIELDEDEPEPVRIAHRYRDPGMTGQFPLVKVVGDKPAGRHREMPIVIPAQREGGADRG